jgi:quercetin dioxygenase-like cupin family protein
MPIVDHNAVPEVPWRPGYRTWDIAGPANGMSTTLTYVVAEAGTGAPLHQHEDEELIVVLEGSVEAQLGDEVRTVGADHTLAIPANVPHAFTVVGDAGAKLLVYFPVPDPFDRTTYLEGSRPEAI